MNWQPIETAPRDGRGMLLADERGIVGEGQFDTDDGSWYWANISSSDYYGHPIHPTHWMPLPAPPLPTPEDKG